MENTTAGGGRAVELPKADVLMRLALSDSGFVFDPVTGNSFTVNGPGLAILRLLQREPEVDSVVAKLCEEYEAEAPLVERDVIEFAALLRNAFK